MKRAYRQNGDAPVFACGKTAFCLFGNSPSAATAMFFYVAMKNEARDSIKTTFFHLKRHVIFNSQRISPLLFGLICEHSARAKWPFFST